jgi:hypothetical protein
VLCVGPPYNFAPSVDKVVREDIVDASSADFTVVVTYDDDHRLDTTTFDNDDIVLTGNASYGTQSCIQNPCVGPTGPWSPKSTTFVAGVGNEFVVTYTFSPANGQWSGADGGQWSINVVANQVAEYVTTPQYVPAFAVGAFTIKSKCSGCWAMSFFILNALRD